MKIENNTLLAIESSDIINGVLTIPEHVNHVEDEVITDENKIVKIIGKSVKSMGNYNIRYCNSLTSVEFPSLESIGNWNICYCDSLTSVEFPSLESMGGWNISSCNSLTLIEFPSLESIGNWNIRSCDSLTSVEFPSLESMGGWNICYCNSLTSVEFKKFKWKTICVDGILFVIENSKSLKGYETYSGFIPNSIVNNELNKSECFVAEKNGFTAHGESIRKAISDLDFKIISVKLKSNPINAEDEITARKYRMITGACDFGVREFLKANSIPYEVKDSETVELEPIKAKDLLPLLEKSNAYGLDKIKQLITF